MSAVAAAGPLPNPPPPQAGEGIKEGN
ncbi:protein of unknown function (plasmid) [Azospirillum baldaniorum]|uniref:Uncharacterized protein n=1 Tax=Azospirillum baldaniorum TaxID=1064539 RepID=A0A9P1K0W3_9PROT|nr:protein of unknown function [Azospirillum baldaniorum]